jgi:hypothetical protein
MTTIKTTTLAFTPGSLYITPNAAKSLNSSDVVAALARHFQQDWGLVEDDDRVANDRAVVNGARILSAYRDCYGTKFWIITEADRKSTSVLLPEDY